MSHGDAVVERLLLLTRGVPLGADRVVHPSGGAGRVVVVGIEVGPEGLRSDGGWSGGRGGGLVVGDGSAGRVGGVVRVRGDVDLRSLGVRSGSGGRVALGLLALLEVVAEGDGSNGRGRVVQGVGRQFWSVRGRHVCGFRLLVDLGVLNPHSTLAGHCLGCRHRAADGSVHSHQYLPQNITSTIY